MTALLQPVRNEPGPRWARLPVPGLAAVAPRPVTRISRLPFVLVVLGVLAVGMVGVLVLNITIQSGAGQLRTLQRQAEEFGYQQAALQSRVDVLRSSTHLASEATRLGMRPDPNPAFIVLPAGTVQGTPARVDGSAMAGLRYSSLSQLDTLRSRLVDADKAAAARAKAEAARAKAAAAKAAAEAARAKASAAKAAAEAARAKAVADKAGAAAAKPAAAKPAATSSGGR